MIRALALFGTLTVIACSKPSTESQGSATGAPASAASAATAEPSPDKKNEKGSAGGVPSTTARVFAGKYVTSVGTMFIPEDKEFKGVKFINDPTKMLGEGSLSLTIDGTGRVSGTTEGEPLGKATIEGRERDGTITAAVRRVDPKDEGLTGTLSAKVEGDNLTGNMKLAVSNAAVVREAKLTATRSPK